MSKILTIFILFFALVTVMSVISVNTAVADHCGGAAIGHPGGTGYTCPPERAPADDRKVIGGGRAPAGGTPTTDILKVELFDPLGDLTLIDFLNKILKLVVTLATPIVVFFIIFAGFQYVIAQGNEEKIKKAHTTITWAIIGALVVLGAKIILEIITGTIDGFVS